MTTPASYVELLGQLGKHPPARRIPARRAWLAAWVVAFRTDPAHARDMVDEARSALVERDTDEALFERGVLDTAAMLIQVDAMSSLSAEERRLARDANAMRLLHLGRLMEDLSQEQLANRIGVDPAQISKLGDRLVAADLAFRVRSGKKKLIRTSARGRVLLQDIGRGAVDGFDPTVAAEAPEAPETPEANELAELRAAVRDLGAKLDSAVQAMKTELSGAVQAMQAELRGMREDMGRQADALRKVTPADARFGGALAMHTLTRTPAPYDDVFLNLGPDRIPKAMPGQLD